MSNYSVIIYTPQELNHSSYIQAGLFELENIGDIKLKINLCTSSFLGRYVEINNSLNIFKNQAYPKVSFYKIINNNTNKSISFALDLYDFSNHFPKVALELCDFVFKRNFENKFISKLPEIYQNKIYPLGLVFGVHSDFKRKDWLFLVGLLMSNFNVNCKIDRLFFKRLINTYKQQINHWNFIKTKRRLSRFTSYQNGTNKNIMFQTRCFLREDQDDVVNIHTQRYHIIKLLKYNFPNNFLGGFIPSKIVNEKYTDALSNVPSDPELYLDVLKSSKIVIYTRGLANSPAWKMAEYLSQGKVIIAERLTAELPVPLDHRKEVLFFDNDEELLNNIKEVLHNDDLCNTLSKNARMYFEKHVHPVQSVKRILDTVIAKLDS